MTSSLKTCWTITDAFPGMQSQVMGLAEVIGLPTVHKTCKRKWPWGLLGLSLGNPLVQLTKGSDPLSPPWPDLVISCGRRSAPLALAIKKQSQKPTFCVHIQNPLLNIKAFDLILSPAHDHLEGPNVIQTKGALHKVTPQKLKEGLKVYGPLFQDLPGPYSTVLLGGNTHRYKMTKKALETLIQQIFQIRSQTQGSVLVTPSFRTPFREILTQAFKDEPHIFLAEIEVLNPYLGMLARADYIFVTDDSVNMLCEACATGKPVYVLPLLGHEQAKSKNFIEDLIQEGTVRLFQGSVDTWTYVPFNDTAKIAALVLEEMGLSQGETNGSKN